MGENASEERLKRGEKAKGVKNKEGERGRERENRTRKSENKRVRQKEGAQGRDNKEEKKIGEEIVREEKRE